MDFEVRAVGNAVLITPNISLLANRRRCFREGGEETGTRRGPAHGLGLGAGGGGKRDSLRTVKSSKLRVKSWRKGSKRWERHLRQELAAPICIALGKVFRELRLKRRLSMYAVAKLAGVSREMVRRVECRLSKPSLDMAARIGSAMGVLLTQAEMEAFAAWAENLMAAL